MFPSKQHYSTVSLCRRCGTHHHGDLNCQSIKCLYCHQIHTISDFHDGICPNISQISSKEKRKSVIKCSVCQLKELNLTMVLRKKKCLICGDKGEIYRYRFCCHSGCAKCDFECLKENEQWTTLKKIMKKTDVLNEEERDCPICLQVINKSQPIYKLECEHIFHKHCAVNWLKITNYCPICRKVDAYFPYEKEKANNNPSFHRAFIIEVIGEPRPDSNQENVPNLQPRRLLTGFARRSNSPPSPSSSNLERGLRRRFGIDPFAEERTNSVASSVSFSQSPIRHARRLSPSRSRSQSRSNSPIRLQIPRLPQLYGPTSYNQLRQQLQASRRRRSASRSNTPPRNAAATQLERRSRSVSRSASPPGPASRLIPVRSISPPPPRSFRPIQIASPSRAVSPQRERLPVQNGVELPRQTVRSEDHMSIEDGSRPTTNHNVKREIEHSSVSQCDSESESKTKERSRQKDKKKRILLRKSKAGRYGSKCSQSNSKGSSSNSSSHSGSQTTSNKQEDDSDKEENISTVNDRHKCLWNPMRDRWIPNWPQQQFYMGPGRIINTSGHRLTLGLQGSRIARRTAPISNPKPKSPKRYFISGVCHPDGIARRTEPTGYYVPVSDQQSRVSSQQHS